MRIEVSCERIRRNAEAIVGMCAASGIEVVGVTKACCGHPEVARAMLVGGVNLLGESRLKNIRRLREACIDAPVMLLRLPSLSEVDHVVRLTQVSLNSELDTIRALSRAAKAHGLGHQVILMVETGDRREGVMPEQAIELAWKVVRLPSIDLAGVGTNLACIGGVIPTKENAELLVDIVQKMERSLGIRLQVISGGHSANLGLVGRGEMPSRVNQLRIGGAILRGMSLIADYPLPCPHQDAFNVVGEVIEVKTKPSLPDGPIRMDAFGRTPHWEDLGCRQRAIVALGEQDLRIDGLCPRRSGVTIVGASSDHLVLDVTEASPEVSLGEELEFAPAYSALATAMASSTMTQIIRPLDGESQSCPPQVN